MIKEKLIGVLNDEVVFIFSGEKSGFIFHKWWKAEGSKHFEKWQKEQENEVQKTS